MPPPIAGHLLESIIANAIGYGTGSAMGPALQPIVQDIANELWQLHPSLPLDLSSAALIARKDPDLYNHGKENAEMQGLGETRFKRLMFAISSPPGLSELLALLQRNHISPDEFNKGLHELQLEPSWHSAVAELRRNLLSFADLANARQQGFIEEAEQHRRSAHLGFSAEDANLGFELSGLPYGIETGIELLRRGKIDEARFSQVVREGHTKTKYTPDLLHLRFQPLSASIAAEALVRERVSASRAREIAAQNGLAQEDFDLYANMLGRPIAPGQAHQAVNRELVGAVGSAESRKFFREVIARSDIRTEYADVLYKLRERLPSLFELRRLIQEGAVDDAYAKEIILAQGYSAKLAQGIVDAAHSQKSKATHELAVSQIRDLYESGLEDFGWATDALKHLGYSDDEAILELEIIEARRLLAALRSQLNVIHRSFVNHKVDRTRAMEEIDALGVGDVARELLLESWDAERAANVTRLTNAQIGQALKHGLIPREDAIARWQNNGYPAADAAVLADLAQRALQGTSPTAA